MAAIDLSAHDLSAPRNWRSTKSKIMSVLLGLSFVVVMIPLAAILVTVIARGAGALSWSFLTERIAASERRRSGGIGPAIVGTLIITGLATLMAVPVGLFAAVYLHEYGGNTKFARSVRFMSTVMSGVPSIVMGLFVYVVWTLRFGFSAFGGSLALACLMLPTIIRSTEEMLRLVPNELRNASLALGGTKARTVCTVVIPAALPGIVSGVLLAVARASGETAPLLFTIGAAKRTNTDPFSGATTALPAQIFSNANSSFDTAIDRGWGAALTLVVLSFSLVVAARLVTALISRKNS